MEQCTIALKGMLQFMAGYTYLYSLVQVYRNLREMAIGMNLHDSSLCTFYGRLWPFLLESCTPGQGCTSWYIPQCTIACFSMLQYIAACTPLYHAVVLSTCHGRCEACTCLYWYALVCTSTCWTMKCHKQYILVFTCTYQDVPVHTTYSVVLT